MSNRADDEGSDVEIYRKALSTTIHVDTRTGAPEELLALLDSLGLERKILTTAGPTYVWHVVPEHLGEDEKKRLATRAIPTLLMAGYVPQISSEVFDTAAYTEAANELTARRASAPPAGQAATPPAGTARPRRTT